MDHTHDAELKADLTLLLECLKCQYDNPAASKQALLTISSICSSNGTIKEYFHECGGLQYILNLLSSTPLDQIKEAALYCLGCCVERNVFLQKKISTSDVFSNLYSLLTCPSSSNRLRQTVCFLILCIVANNSHGQVLAMRSGCLQALMQIFRSCLVSVEPSEVIQEPLPSSSLQLWSSAASALSMCVNNPQNDDNQRLCATLLPYTFKLLQECQQESVVRPLAAFLGLLVANNVYNQDRVRKCGGLEVIISVLQRLSNQSRRQPQQLSLALHVVTTLDACITDNAVSADTAGDHEAVQTLLSLLSLPELDEVSQLQVILTLGHITDLSVNNQTKFIEASGLPLLLNLMGASEDEEVCKAVKYVLQACVQAVKSEPSGAGERIDPQHRQHYGLQDIHHMESFREEPQSRDANLDSVILDKINLLSEKLESMERANSSLERQKTSAVAAVEMPRKHTVENISNSIQPSLDKLLRNWNSEIEKTSERNLDDAQKFVNFYNSHIHTNRNIPSRETFGTKEGLDLTDIFEDASPSFDSPTINLSVKVPEAQLRSESENCLIWRSEQNLRSTFQKGSKAKDEGTQLVMTSKQGVKDNTQKESMQHSEDVQPVRRCREGVKSNSQKESKNPSGVTKSAQCQSEQLVEELRQEKEKRELLEKEAASLREALEKQKHKESESVALREELERQESEAIVSSSSEESDEPGEQLQQILLEASDAPLAAQSSAVASEEMRTSSHQAEGNMGSNCDKGLFVKPTKLPKISLRRAQTLAKSSTPCKTFHCNSGEHRNRSSWQEKRTLRKSPSPAASHGSVRSVDLNVSISSEFDFKLLAKARSTGDLNERVSRHSRALSDCSVRRLQQPMTSTPMFVTCHERFSYDSQAYSVKARNSRPSQFSRGQGSLERGRSADREAWRLGEGDIGDNDDDMMSCRSAPPVSLVPSTGLCPGCCPPRACGLPLLNSRTFNIALETNPHTCAGHRLVRKLERQFIHAHNRTRRLQVKTRPLEELNGKPTRHGCGDGIGKGYRNRPSPSVYDFMSSADNTPEQSVTPPYQMERTCPTGEIQPKPRVGARRRKPRVPYTEEETDNLLTGVENLGRHWNQILCTYEFHPSRTAVDLMEKHKRLMAAEKNQENRKNVRPDPMSAGPFSLCEERRLKRGVKQFGYNWKLILDEFRFASGRTKEQLREKWRGMHKDKLTQPA